MAKRPPESLKETANQLAHYIANGNKETGKIQALERKLLLNRAPSSANITIKKVPKPGESVGIWAPARIEGKKYYTRDEKYKQEFNQWARVHEIPPKSSKKRIVYLGESVSRGYLLDPFYTPASVLEVLLNSKPGLLQAEVVDLARNDLLINDLTDLCSSCLALEPDVLVIFAGNNWVNGFSFTEDLAAKIIEVMGTQNRFSSLKPILENQYKKMVSSFMKHAAGLSKAYQVPVLYVIPEYNLLDFQSSWVQQINTWPKGETGTWLRLKDEIQTELGKGNIERAEELSHEMIKLNQGNPLGYELLARCKLERELFPEATKWLRMALDTAMFRGQNVPGCLTVIRDTLLEEAAKYNMTVVDLPEVFSRYQRGRPPGKELFLDYCHLSVEGIQVAMTSTAQKLFSILTDKEIPGAELGEKAPTPNNDVIARAHFFAAIHNAHRGEQPFDILYYHCLQSLNKSAKVTHLMLNYSEMVSYHTTWCLSKWCKKMFESGEMAQFPNILQPNNLYLMDIALVDAMAAALKRHGIDIEPRILKLRKKEHSFLNGKINLLESYYHLASYIASYRPNNSYYKAFSPQSRFFLVTGVDNDVELKLTYRVPHPDRNLKKEKVFLDVNNCFQKELPAFDYWQNFTLKVPGQSLKDGINTITILWPPNICYKKDVKNGPVRFQRDLMNQMMYPVYGEIYRFEAKRVEAQDIR
ncbi:MAG: hypothetical protein GTO45_27040 [Candidatus Aminicenantes bacterium]|nr:hypothetical protein [Candidatus Aminicenantes bacterium]NIM82440.1 hypothetical protein [Candidatus Aminicenantes bacterium]NIN21801.1 hypothetical protein [Candidatus Aminicenantes bacterium]NIN45593.1 hypothetical protein [Candidatus Aminicenantes bacterium]NIN88424.1 hypothetical protein [Candidatus Aminicenantes bacterium]